MTFQTVPLPLFPEPEDGGVDEELENVRAELVRLDPEGQRFAAVLRETIDQLLNGERTGRYDWKQLFKTEKTHAGTMVEINLQREFEFGDGKAMDYEIAGVEVDCKYSQLFGGWMIPPEAMGHLCLVVWADDYRSKWSAGLVRIRPEILNGGGNRDLKLTIQAAHRNRIAWLWKDAALPENVLLHLDSATRSQVLIPGRRQGQKRVNQLFRLVLGRRIGRGVVRTAAQQVDYMARVREGDKGRARPKLREEGIIVLGDYPVHQAIAAALGGPVPGEGEFVSHRVVRALPSHGERPSAEIEGGFWVVAGPGEWEHDRGPAPRLPDPQANRG
ncbi:restriction endonuclease [Kitasatospora xanthocidica]|uniref:Restriction endonuclease n=1 Tax=Kitasatospora xanthocidica TaxID=83382 RepID=A0A372ZSN4_9ACTN|nr:NaeI family type II restriction endonuclease [Kitasatospora xanthocidica]RGD58237.1 restriction endonuclease [Kitasatospora xanthocidica]